MAQGITIGSADPALLARLAKIQEIKAQGAGMYSSLGVFERLTRQAAQESLAEQLQARFGVSIAPEFVLRGCEFVYRVLFAIVEGRRAFHAAEYRWAHFEHELYTDDVLSVSAWRPPEFRQFACMARNPGEHLLWIPDYGKFLGPLADCLGANTKNRSAPPAALRSYWETMRRSGEVCLDYISYPDGEARSCSISGIRQVVRERIKAAAKLFEATPRLNRSGEQGRRDPDLLTTARMRAEKVAHLLDSDKLPIAHDKIEDSESMTERLYRELRFGDTEGERMLARILVAEELAGRNDRPPLVNLLMEMVTRHKGLVYASQRSLDRSRNMNSPDKVLKDCLVQSRTKLLRRYECELRALTQNIGPLLEEFDPLGYLEFVEERKRNRPSG